MGAGSIGGGLIIPMGRRNTLIYFNLFSLISCGLTLIENIHLIIIGKLLFGFSSGVLNVAGPKMLDETCPVHLIGAFGSITVFY